MRKIAFILCMIFSLASWGNPLLDKKFKDANSAYEAGKFEVAISEYQSLLKSGIDGFNLHFNLGNSFYKIEEYPLAILHYEKALKIDPSNDDVKKNLKLSYAKTTDKIEPAKELVINRWYAELINLNSADNWATYSTGLLFVALLFSLLYLFGSSVLLKRIGFFSGVLILILSILCLALAYQQEEYHTTSKSAIIFTPTVSIKSAPGESGTVLFVLHEGTKVKLLDRSNNWINVALPNGNKGWVQDSDLREI